MCCSKINCDIRLYSTRKEVQGTLQLIEVFSTDYWIALICVVSIFSVILSCFAMCATKTKSPHHIISATVLSFGSQLPLDVTETISKDLAGKVHFRILLFSLLILGEFNFSIFGGHLVSKSVAKSETQIDTLNDLLRTNVDQKFIMHKGRLYF